MDVFKHHLNVNIITIIEYLEHQFLRSKDTYTKIIFHGILNTIIVVIINIIICFGT